MNTDPHNKPLSPDTVINQAKDFLQQYYRDTVNHEKPALSLARREREVLQQISQTGSYQISQDELVWGARMAWRNAPRCPARVIWKRLEVFDKVGDIHVIFYREISMLYYQLYREISVLYSKREK